MVLVRRKRVLFHDVPEELRHLIPDQQNGDTNCSAQLDASGLYRLPASQDRDVFYIPDTGEIFLDYETYAARMTFYKLNIFMCEVTGKGNMDFFAAMKSEQSESTVLHARFPEQLKAAVLRAVQWQIVGRLDHLVEAVFDRFKDRYFKGEKIYVDVQGDKYLARIVKVFPPRNLKAVAAATTSSPIKLKLKLTNNAAPVNTNGISNGINGIHLAAPEATSPGSSSPGATSSTSKAPSKYKPSPTQRVARSYPSVGSPSHIPVIGSPLATPMDHSDTKSSLDSLLSGPSAAPVEPLIHTVGADLKLSLEEAVKLDDPTGYYYSVQMLGEGAPDTDDNLDGHATTSGDKWSGTEMEVTCAAMSRDRLGFNKALLKRFLKDALDRTNAVASPWVVKPQLAEKYGIETQMPQDVKEGVEGVKKLDYEKRRKIWEDREGPPNKKRKGMLTEEEKVARDAEELKRQQELERMEAEADLAARRAAAAKKRGIRYPTEDLDVKLSDRDRKMGKCLTRPKLNKNVPFGKSFETFLMTWNFLVTFGKALNLSPFTLDEYERALKHSLVELPCNIIADIHCCLIDMVKERPFERHCAIISLMELKTADAGPDMGVTSSEHEKEDDWQVEIDELVAALADVGVSWETTTPTLFESDVRDGWEPVLVGFLKDYATTATFPRLRPILTHLVYGPSPPLKDDESEAGSVVEPCHPSDRYPSLPVEDKLAVIMYLCDLAMACKPIRNALEAAEVDLTDLRKEKIEVNRERKRLAEELNQVNGAINGSATTAPLTAGNLETNTKALADATSSTSGPNSDMDVDSEKIDAASDLASEFGGSSTAGNGTRNGKDSSSRPGPKSIAHAKERAIAREKEREAKAAQASHRRKDDDLAKLDRRLEAIEREFRQIMGLSRTRPLGRDRFYNRIWWCDGLGSASLLGHSGNVVYGTGRLFFQGPSEVDFEVMEGRDDFKSEVIERRLVEEGEDGTLGSGEWACYSEPEQLEAFAGWLNVKGQREFQLDKSLKLWWDYLIAGMRKRTTDLTVAPQSSTMATATSSSSRRASRGKAEVARESYMTWTNKRR
ncbi:hypothetical protein FRB94_004765 [Tulasnella sp. JGI-2019a]|nr:hypothetical protein FRB94_004765 [Tulasnella sp. JGI-2019a]